MWTQAQSHKKGNYPFSCVCVRVHLISLLLRLRLVGPGRVRLLLQPLVLKHLILKVEKLFKTNPCASFAYLGNYDEQLRFPILT